MIFFGGFLGTNKHTFDMDDFDRADATFANTMLNHEVHETVSNLSDVKAGLRESIDTYDKNKRAHVLAYNSAHGDAKVTESKVMGAIRTNEGVAKDGSAVYQYTKDGGTNFYYETSQAGTTTRHNGLFKP